MSLSEIVNIFVHLDKYLILALERYGIFTYILLFLLIFLETGLVIMPFLPGDSLIFVAGTVVAASKLNFFVLLVILILAAILGDTVNYWIGKYFGKRLSNSRFVKKEYLWKTEEFYNKYGGATIIIARFIPIIRTFAPFIAGISDMEYKKFLSFNIIGGISWVAVFLIAGYFFGNIPFVQNNLTIIVWLLILISLVPPFYKYIEYKIHKIHN